MKVFNSVTFYSIILRMLVKRFSILCENYISSLEIHLQPNHFHILNSVLRNIRVIILRTLNNAYQFSPKFQTQYFDMNVFPNFWKVSNWVLGLLLFSCSFQSLRWTVHMFALQRVPQLLSVITALSSWSWSVILENLLLNLSQPPKHFFNSRQIELLPSGKLIGKNSHPSRLVTKYHRSRPWPSSDHTI